MERRPAVGSKCGVGILHVCQVKDHHQERSDNNIDCSPSHLAHYIKKTVTVRFILDHPVYTLYLDIYNIIWTDLRLFIHNGAAAKALFVTLQSNHSRLGQTTQAYLS